MKFNEEANWPEILGGQINRPNLADPTNRSRATFVLTMLFLEAGRREVSDQLSGHSSHWKGPLTWARITREIVVKRARSIANEELSEHDRQNLSIGQRGFRERWEPQGQEPQPDGSHEVGTVFRFIACVFRYVYTDPRWQSTFDHGPRKALKGLPKVGNGELELSELVTTVAKLDLNLRIRLYKYWQFLLSLTMDTRWKSVATRAYRELLEAYVARWEPVYEEFIRELHVNLRPGRSPNRLCAAVSALMEGYVSQIGGSGEPYPCGDDDFAEDVQHLIFSAIDQGDELHISKALNMSIRSGNAANVSIGRVHGDGDSVACVP